MSVEAITDILHEYMYEKLNDSPETEEEKKIRYVNKRKHTQTKKREINQHCSKKPTVTDVASQTGQHNTNAQPEERNAQNAENRATSQNAADPTKR